MENAQIAQLTLGSLIALFSQEALKTSAAEAIKSLKDALVSRFSGKKEAEKALRNLEKLPHDEDFQQDFNEVLLTALEDPELLAEITALLKPIGQEMQDGGAIRKTNTQTVKGDHNIGLQDISGSTININQPPRE